MSCIPPIPKIGMMATARTIIPIPPIQWAKQRQKMIDFGIVSIDVRIVAPVVEKPDVISKNAEAKFGIAPER